MASNTYNRGKLKKEIEKGQWLVKCDGRYTDDYAGDAASNYGITEFRPAVYFPDFWLWLEQNPTIKAKYDEAAKSPDFYRLDGNREYSKIYHEELDPLRKLGMVFDQNEFRGYGSAWSNEDGTVHLSFGYVSYTFKRKN